MVATAPAGKEKKKVIFSKKKPADKNYRGKKKWKKRPCAKK